MMEPTKYDDIAHLNEINQQISRHLDLHSVVKYVTAQGVSTLPFKVTSTSSRFNWYAEDAHVEDVLLRDLQGKDDQTFLYGRFDEEVEDFAIRFAGEDDITFVLKLEHGLIFYRVFKDPFGSTFRYMCRHVCKTFPTPSLDTLIQKIIDVDQYVKDNIKNFACFPRLTLPVPDRKMYRQMHITRTTFNTSSSTTFNTSFNTSSSTSSSTTTPTLIKISKCPDFGTLCNI